MELERLKGYIGLAARARQLTYGAEQVCQMIRAGKAKIVLIDESASENTLKKVRDACQYRKIPYRMVPQGVIAAACGKMNVMALSMPKGGLSEAVAKAIPETVEEDFRPVPVENEWRESAGGSVE